MPKKFARRQDTDVWWNIRINNLIDRGEELREPGILRTVDDLKVWRDKIQRWRADAASTIGGIYHDTSLADEFCPHIGSIDLEDSSRSDLKGSLKSMVEERVNGLRNLVERTRAEERSRRTRG